MPDITALILEQHGWFRDQFAALDELQAKEPVDVAALEQVWHPLGEKLDVHAAAEEAIFYPQLLRVGADDPEDETLDAIGDHNDIRDGVAAAREHPTGSAPWWQAVGAAREANDEHMGEEEREGLSDFRRHGSMELRQSLGQQFLDFFAEHPTSADLDITDIDPTEYVQTIEAALQPGPALQDDADVSLGIGSLKGRSS